VQPFPPCCEPSLTHSPPQRATVGCPVIQPSRLDRICFLIGHATIWCSIPSDGRPREAPNRRTVPWRKTYIWRRFPRMSGIKRSPTRRTHFICPNRVTSFEPQGGTRECMGCRASASHIHRPSIARQFDIVPGQRNVLTQATPKIARPSHVRQRAPRTSKSNHARCAIQRLSPRTVKQTRG